MDGIKGIKSLLIQEIKEKLFGLELRLELIPVMPITPKIYHNKRTLDGFIKFSNEKGLKGIFCICFCLLIITLCSVSLEAKDTALSRQ